LWRGGGKGGRESGRPWEEGRNRRRKRISTGQLGFYDSALKAGAKRRVERPAFVRRDGETERDDPEIRVATTETIGLQLAV